MPVPRLPLLVAALTLASPALAADGPAAPPVEELVVTALASSPAVAAQAAALAAQREREPAAGALPDPLLEATLQNAGLSWSVGDEPMSMLAARVRQGLPWPGKREAARAEAAAKTHEREIALDALERDLAVSVRTLYAKVFALDHEREALLAARELVDLFTETARSRYAAGGGEQEGVIKAGLEALRIEERLADLATARASLVADLNRWLDRPGSATLGMVTAVPEPPAPAADLEARAAALAPGVATAEAALATAERRVESARLALQPDLSVAAGAGYRGSLDPVVTLGVGVELPLWKRRKQLPLLRAAEGERERARHLLEDARAVARADAARQLVAFEVADEQARRYREGILPSADAALDAARSSYLAGRGDFSTVIEDFDLWLEARVQLARREADRYSAWALLEHHVGGVPHAGDDPHPAGHPGSQP